MKFKSLFCTLLCAMTIAPVIGTKNAAALTCAQNEYGKYCEGTCCKETLQQCVTLCVRTPSECMTMSDTDAYKCSTSCTAPSASMCDTCCPGSGGDTPVIQICGNGTYGTNGNCTKCPEPGTSPIGNATKITDCYIPANQVQTDDSGTFFYTSNCNYSNKLDIGDIEIITPINP